MREMRNTYKFFLAKPYAKRILGSPRPRWEDNIRTDLTDTMWEVVEWIHLAQKRDQWRALVQAVMNLRVLQKAEDFLTE
jgi:hypothetical protein